MNCAVRRRRDHVFPEVRVIPDPGQGQWVQGLHQQGADATDQHAAEIAMHLPADGVRAEQARVALGVVQVELTQRQATQAHHLGFDTTANEFHTAWLFLG